MYATEASFYRNAFYQQHNAHQPIPIDFQFRLEFMHLQVFIFYVYKNEVGVYVIAFDLLQALNSRYVRCRAHNI